MTEFLYYFFLFGALICCIVAPILACTSVIFGGITSKRDHSKEQADELKKQTDIMQRNRQEAWSDPNYFQSDKREK